MAAKNLGNSLAEIYKRVPPNQMKQFIQLREKTAEYKTRVGKFPEQLPKIDWDYYKKNVRTDYVKLVDEFEKKYEEFGKVFDERDKVDTKKYYEELEKMKLEVRGDIDKYIAESNDRIKCYEAEIERLRNMIPTTEMTCEEFCENFPEEAPMLGVGRPSFWPHRPEEQTPGPADPLAGHEEEEEDEHAREAALSSVTAAGAEGAEAPVAAAGVASTDAAVDVTAAKSAELKNAKEAVVKSAETANTQEPKEKPTSEEPCGEVEESSKKDGDPKTDGGPKKDGDKKS